MLKRGISKCIFSKLEVAVFMVYHKSEISEESLVRLQSYCLSGP